MRRFVLPVMAASAMGAMFLSAPAHAGFASVDFEDQAVSADDARSDLSVVTDLLTIDVSREGGGRFGIADFSSSSGTIAFGSRSLVPNDASNGALLMNFSLPVTNVSLQMGDFGDDADELRLQAFSGPNGSGEMVDEFTATLVPVGTTFSFETLEVTGDSIGSVRAIGGFGGDNSVAYDNVAAQAIPLPAAALAAGPVLAAIGGMSWLRKRKAASR